ncbi:MAG: sulfotransferase family protein [Egibacteraceae bacterium]
MLEFPCYHMLDVMANPERTRPWLAAIDGQPVDWEEIFGGYQATVDLPGLAFWRELVDAYPDAKVLLSVRDPARWYDSMDRTILQVRRLGMASGFSRSSGFEWMPPPELIRLRETLLGRMFNGRIDSREHAIEVFERHNQEVRRYVRADRLLVYEVSRGWEPLCAFLGVPVPATPFPRLNSAESFQDRLEATTTQTPVGAVHASPADRRAAETAR